MIINELKSDRDRIRTCDRLLRRQMLYPAELRDRSWYLSKRNTKEPNYYFNAIAFLVVQLFLIAVQI